MTFIVPALIFLLAGYHIYRMRPNSVKDVIQKTGATVIGFWLAVLLIGTVLPRFFVNSSPQIYSNWQGVASTGAHEVGATLGIGTGAPAAPEEVPPPGGGETEPYLINDEVQAAPTTAAVTEPDLGYGIAVAGSLPATVRGASSVQATGSYTTTQKATLYRQLAAAKAAANRTAAEGIIAQIYDLDPNDPTAQQAAYDLQQAKERLAQYASLSTVEVGAFIPADSKDEVRSKLFGGSYMVLSSGAQLWKGDCQEYSTVQDITPDAWTNGETFQVPRCLLQQFNASYDGRQFSVR